IEVREHLRADQIGHSLANGALLRDQGYHPAGGVGRPAVVVRPLPEASYPVADAGPAALQVGEIDLEDQRAVTKDPNRSPTVAGKRAVERSTVDEHLFC